MTPDKHNSKKWTVLAYLTLVFVFSLNLLYGDIIHFKDGRSIEGKIIKEGPKQIEIKTKFGTVKIDRARILKIEYKKTADDTYQKMLKKLDRKDAYAIYDLAMWCKKNGKKQEYRKHLDEALLVDDQHDLANKEIGNIKFDGKWFTAKDLKNYKVNKEKRMKEQGYIFYAGQWMPEAEAKALMGYVEWEGEYIPRIEQYHRMGDRDIEKTFGYPMRITDSEHFTIRSKGGTEEHHNELLDYCELELEHFLMTFKPNEKELEIMLYYPIPIYILPDMKSCVTFMESDYIKRYNPPKDEKNRYAPNTNFSIYFPRPLVVLSEGKHLVGADSKNTSQIGYMSHHVGHILIRRFKRGGKVPGWVETGVAHYYEGLTNFYQTISICEYRDYEDAVKWKKNWGNFMEWKKKLVDSTFHSKLPTVKELMALKIETMNSQEMAKAWSVTTFLLEKYPVKFVEFVRRYFDDWRGEKKLTQEQAWKVGFEKITPEQIEDQWRSWIVEQPIAPSRRDRLLINPK